MPDPGPALDPAPPTGPARALIGRWLALLAAIALLHLCGRGALRRPSLAVLSGRSVSSPPPIETAMAVVRLIAVGAGIYLLVILTVALIGRAVGHRPTLALAARLTPPSLRSALALATAGVTLTVTTGVAAAVPPPAPTLRWTGPPSSTATTPPALRWTGPASSSTPPTLRWTGPLRDRPSPLIARPAPSGQGRLPTSPSSTGTTSPSTVGRTPATASTRPTWATTVPPPAIRESNSNERQWASYVIRPGDSFWNIAATRLQRGRASTPDEESVARYWRLLLKANSKDLPVPGQPDLLFPGDRVQLPPVG